MNYQQKIDQDVVSVIPHECNLAHSNRQEFYEEGCYRRSFFTENAPTKTASPMILPIACGAILLLSIGALIGNTLVNSSLQRQAAIANQKASEAQALAATQTAKVDAVKNLVCGK